MRDRFSILVDSISEEMGVMLWGRNGEGVEELEGMWRVKVFSTDPLLKPEGYRPITCSAFNMKLGHNG